MIIFCASDAGGSRNIIPVIQALDGNKHSFQVICSSVTKPLFDQSGIKSEKIDLKNAVQTKEFLKRLDIEAVICGTTMYESSDRTLMRVCGELNIPCVCVLDEWFNIIHRFKSEKDQICFPKIICCPDEKAKEEAIKEGIPSRYLKVTGSPALTQLYKQGQNFKKNAPDKPEFLKGKKGPFILFLSETHAADYGMDQKGGPLGNFLGYTESSVAKDLKSVLESLHFKGTVIEKLHPNDKAKEETHQVPGMEWLSIKTTPLWPLIYFSDFVVGMRSMALLEAVILGKNPVSYQPNLIGPQQCSAVNMGLIRCLKTKTELADWIKESLSGTRGPSKAKRSFSFVKADCPQKILKLAGIK